MGRGRRYDNEPKLNIKKVIAVIVAALAIVMFVLAIKELIKSDSSSNNLVSTQYFLINKSNKWGVIDNNSKIIIEPTYSDAIIIPNSKKDVFICTYDSQEDGQYKIKVVNSSNKEIFNDYDKVLPLENYDENYNLFYNENCLKVEKEGKIGLIDFSGTKILNCEYTDIYTLKGINNSLITVKDEMLGLVDEKGREIISNQYDNITSLGDNTKMYIVKENEKYGIYGVLSCKYDEIINLNSKDIFYVKDEGKYKLINKNEENIFNEKFDKISSLNDNNIVYEYKNKYYAYNLDGNKKLDKGYEELRYTSNGLYIFKENNKYGIINNENDIKIEAEYDNINFYKDVEIYELEKSESDLNDILNKNLDKITDGIVNKADYDNSYIKIWKQDGYKYYNLSGEEKKSSEILVQNNLFLDKKDGKYGFIDKKGNVVVDYIYDDAKEQNEFGYIAVKKSGLWGALDKNGKEICSTKYNLDENLLIDFIGEYHLGKDINLMYYTDKQ